MFFKDIGKRADYPIVQKLLEAFSKEYDWKKINENSNLIGLKLDGKSISLEPGNQLELAGDKLNNIHEVCSESYNFQDQLKKFVIN